jgi:hypothetical protein
VFYVGGTDWAGESDLWKSLAIFNVVLSNLKHIFVVGFA